MGDVEDAVPGQASGDAVVVAADEEAPAAVQAREDLPGVGLGAAVAEIAEVPDGVAGADGRVPARDEALVVGLDRVEGTSQPHPAFRRCARWPGTGTFRP